MRAQRRHHYARIKKKRVEQLKHEGGWSRKDIDARACLLATTGTLCSCFNCGNPRKTKSGSRDGYRLTLRERQNNITFSEQLREGGEE